jgi:ATP-dependent RNA helicase SUPV3L1/SUV3
MCDRRGDFARAVARVVAAAVGPTPRSSRVASISVRGSSSRRWSASAASCPSWFDAKRVAARDVRASRIGVASFARSAGDHDARSEDAPKPSLKGITLRANGRAAVRVSGGGVKQKSLGTYDTIEQAVEAYNAEAIARGVPTQEVPSTTNDEKSSGLSRSKTVVVPPTVRVEPLSSTPTPKPPISGDVETNPVVDPSSDWRVDPSLRSRFEHLSPDAIVRLVLDMTDPGKWYPAARAMKRKIHLHVGPTNSGKTYAAVQRLKNAESGVYCSPLRLLAWEIAEGFNTDASAALRCDLVTGQEKRIVAGSRHVACTVEMADVRRVVDVAVIDEAHLLGDANRGYAFTRAVLGLPASELHLCGDPAMVPLIVTLAKELGDELTIHAYERLQALSVLKEPLRKIKDVSSGDCLIAFSRKAVHQLKKDVETEAGKRACVVYGSLPPEARAKQAELFNDRANSGYDVLIASDAIGMGLNLSIRRIIFTTLVKFDGEASRGLRPPEAKQIAGRAGRFGMGSHEGGATTMRKDSLKELRRLLESPIVDLKEAAVSPTLDQIALYCEARPGARLPEALGAFARDSATSDHYFSPPRDDAMAAARLVEHLPLTLEDHWMFAIAPCSAEDLRGAGSQALVTFAEAFVKRGRVSVRVIRAPPFDPPQTQGALSVLEQAHAGFDLYLWFSLRCPVAFPEHDYAQALRKACAAAIELGLQRSSTA